MILGHLGGCFGAGLRHARCLPKLRRMQNLKTNLEHALHPFGGGGSKRFAHAAAPFFSKGNLEGLAFRVPYGMVSKQTSERVVLGSPEGT